MGKMLDSTLSWIFEKMAKAYVHRTGNRLSDAKVPVVQEVDGKPYFNLSSIGSADLAKLSGANGIDGTIAEAISGLRNPTYVYSYSTDDINTTKNFDGIRTTWTNKDNQTALFCKLYIPQDMEAVDSPDGTKGDWVCFQRQYGRNYFVQQFAWQAGVVSRIWMRLWDGTSWSGWKLLVDAS